MSYLLNQEPVSFDDLYIMARYHGYRGARGVFWVSGFLWSKGYYVHEKVPKLGTVEVGR